MNHPAADSFRLQPGWKIPSALLPLRQNDKHALLIKSMQTPSWGKTFFSVTFISCIPTGDQALSQNAQILTSHKLQSSHLLDNEKLNQENKRHEAKETRDGLCRVSGCGLLSPTASPVLFISSGKLLVFLF